MMNAELAFEKIKSRAEELSELFKVENLDISNDFLWMMLLMLILMDGWKCDKEEMYDAEPVSGV